MPVPGFVGSCPGRAGLIEVLVKITPSRDPDKTELQHDDLLRATQSVGPAEGLRTGFVRCGHGTGIDADRPYLAEKTIEGALVLVSGQESPRERRRAGVASAAQGDREAPPLSGSLGMRCQWAAEGPERGQGGSRLGGWRGSGRAGPTRCGGLGREGSAGQGSWEAGLRG